MALSKKWNMKTSLRGRLATAAISSLLFLAACGDDSSSSSPNDNGTSSSSGFVYEQDSSAFVQPEVVAVKDKSISGVSQKGPFVTGSAVKLYELDGKTYSQTGKSFAGKITSDDGKFSFARVTLASQYALLETNGYFRNEITGAKSKGTITLNALTDLSDRKTVNVNLLTHLEYERTLYLVGSGINVSSAKKQADAEILNAFGIKGEFASSDDLDIFSEGESNAALLAFSVLMLRDLNEADLTELLIKFATDIESDGIWNDESAKARIADWAAVADLNGDLATIRSNIVKWNFGTVPEFEKYIRNFWYTNYGLNECSSDNEAVVLATKNEFSARFGSQTRYICKDGAWIEATDFEKDFYQSDNDNGDDGELWMGPVTGKAYKYDEVQDKWLTATHNDSTLKLMGCTTNRTGEIGKSPIDDIYYECKDMDWQEAQEFDYDTYGEKCTSIEIGKTISGVLTAANKYCCTANGWVSLNGDWSWDVPKEARLNPEITYGTITDSRDNKVYKTIKIGDQIWMAENLNYADSTKTPSLLNHSWCYDDKEENCAVAGRLYTWAAAIDSVVLYDGGNGVDCGYGKTCILPTKVQGICPNGWHLPTVTEWNTLFTEVGGSTTASKILKSQTGWRKNQYGKRGNGVDGVGFSALPAGDREYYVDGDFIEFDFGGNGRAAVFWSAYEEDVDYAWYVLLLSWPDYPKQGGFSKGSGASVRCLQDQIRP